MNKADELQTLFQDFRPDLSSNRLFMEKLSRKLDAVEYIKQVQDRQIRRYKYAVLVAFLAGGICCAVLMAFLYVMPEQTPLWNFDSEMKFLVFLKEHSRIFALSFTALLMSFCIVNGVSVMHEKVDYTSKSM